MSKNVGQIVLGTAAIVDVPVLPARVSADKHQIAFIQILRGAAALIVVWSHLSGFWLFANNEQWSVQNLFQVWIVVPFHIFQNGGHLGVVLFFLISGYIITHAALRETKISFIVKRIFRIFPALMAALAVTWLMLLLAHKEGFALPGIHDGGTAFQWGAAVFMLDGFIPGARILGTTWTLVVELVFYALTLLVLDRSRIKPLTASFIMLGLWMVLSVVAKNVTMGDNNIMVPMVGFLIAGRAIYLAQQGFISHYYATLLIIAALGGYVLFSEAMAPGQLFKPGGWGGVEPVVSDGIALFVFFALMKAPIARVWAPFNFFGNISYSLYLLHLPVGMTVLNVLHNAGVNFSVCFFAAVLSSILVSYLSYLYVEKPTQRLARFVLGSHKKLQETSSL